MSFALSGYHIEMLLTYQLVLIIGFRPLIDSCFGNLGNKLLCEKLCKIYDNFEMASNLFELIDLNFYLCKKNELQTVLGTVQSTLICYYTGKILTDIEDGVPEIEIRKSIDTYKKALITKELLNSIGKDPSNYPNLDVSINEFNKLNVDNLMLKLNNNY